MTWWRPGPPPAPWRSWPGCSSPGGCLAIVEFDKIDGPPGPPRHIRLDPAEVEALVAPYGFARQRTVKLGPYNYLMTFMKS